MFSLSVNNQDLPKKWWLSVARQVESLVDKALVRAGRLRQAVLRSAFEGIL